MTDMHSFQKAKTNAINELNEMKKRACENGGVFGEEQLITPHKNEKVSGKNLGVHLSSDDLIIIGLILILSKDCKDTWLFLALIYILM